VVAPPRPASRRPTRRPGPRRVTRAELAAATWLLREPGSGTRAAAEDVFAQLDLGPRILNLGSNGAIVNSVLIGLGITLISRDAVAEQLATAQLEEWTHGPLPLERAWHLVTRAGEPLAATPALFLDGLLAAGWKKAQ
jgi:DNA-binding transcriptional LysR family regulator